MGHNRLPSQSQHSRWQNHCRTLDLRFAANKLPWNDLGQLSIHSNQHATHVHLCVSACFLRRVVHGLNRVRCFHEPA